MMAASGAGSSSTPVGRSFGNSRLKYWWDTTSRSPAQPRRRPGRRRRQARLRPLRGCPAAAPACRAVSQNPHRLPLGCLTNGRAKRVALHQIRGRTEHVGQLGTQRGQADQRQVSAGIELGQQVNVAVGMCLAARHRAEYPEPGHAALDRRGLGARRGLILTPARTGAHRVPVAVGSFRGARQAIISRIDGEPWIGSGRRGGLEHRASVRSRDTSLERAERAPGEAAEAGERHRLFRGTP